MTTRIPGFTAVFVALILLSAPAQAEVYHHFFGNTHSHSRFSDGKENPSDHFRLARAAGYDFYAVTDHALKKYPEYTPDNWKTTKRQANEATDSRFVALVGFEFSENDGPGGTGHLTVLNTASTLDATGPGVSLPVFYDWLVTNQPTTVAASFNHAAKTTYNSYDYLTPARRDGVTMFEMINSGKLHYDGFLAALNKGWRVAPNGGEDGHGTGRITKDAYRTCVLAYGLTGENIMQAIRARRVYCTWDSNLRLTFRANGEIMGSVLSNPTSLSCTIRVADPDIKNAKDRITKIEIVGENGSPIRARQCSSHTASWSFVLTPTQKYYFVQVYCADKTDGPTAYSAPVWIENPVKLLLMGTATATPAGR